MLGTGTTKMIPTREKLWNYRPNRTPLELNNRMLFQPRNKAIREISSPSNMREPISPIKRDKRN